MANQHQNRLQHRYGLLLTRLCAIGIAILSLRATRLISMSSLTDNVKTSLSSSTHLDLPSFVGLAPAKAEQNAEVMLPKPRTSSPLLTEALSAQQQHQQQSLTMSTADITVAATHTVVPPILIDTIALYDNVTMAHMRALSSVDYFTCCGLGHRISKNADAFYVASRRLNFSLRVNWASCDVLVVGNHSATTSSKQYYRKQEVSQYLFGPQPPSMVRNITSTGLAVKLHNEVFGFKKLIREGKAAGAGECKCVTTDKYNSDVEYFQLLRDRFRLKDQVGAFVKRTFQNHAVIGMHVRAGNNETGDFTKKNRAILDRDIWVKNMVRRLVNLTELSTSTALTKPPLLYIATDTASMVTMFRTALQGIMPVIDFPQRRLEENKGVTFGGAKDFQQHGDDCLLNWENVVMDMMILSYADVIVAARPSSFSQSLPMILSYAREYKDRVFSNNTFCEINHNATDMRCYASFREWCCEGIGQFSLAGLSQRYEYLRVPTNVWNTAYAIRSRPRQVQRKMYQRDFLPYEYSNEIQVSL